MLKKSTLLFVSIFVLLFIGLSDYGYGCNEGTKHNTGEPCAAANAGETPECQIEFCIDFVAGDNKVTSDGNTVPGGFDYCHGFQKVLAFTGSEPGFRFDTNRSQKLEGAGGSRFLSIDLTAFDSRLPFNEALKGVDLRFDQSEDGLDLCSLVEGSDTVGLSIMFEVDDANDNRHTLIYGTPEFTGPSGNGPVCGQPVTVTRIGPATWTISGTNACLMDGSPASGFVLDREKDASFFATITAIE